GGSGGIPPVFSRYSLSGELYRSRPRAAATSEPPRPSRRASCHSADPSGAVDSTYAAGGTSISDEAGGTSSLATGSVIVTGPPPAPAESRSPPGSRRTLDATPPPPSWSGGRGG